MSETVTTTITPTEGVTYVQVGGCAWCNGDHTGLCPLVLEFEYYEHGGFKRIKFVEPAERSALGAKVKIAPGDGRECGSDRPQGASRA